LEYLADSDSDSLAIVQKFEQKQQKKFALKFKVSTLKVRFGPQKRVTSFTQITVLQGIHKLKM
jgi:hypothetical protein